MSDGNGPVSGWSRLKSAWTPWAGVLWAAALSAFSLATAVMSMTRPALAMRKGVSRIMMCLLSRYPFFAGFVGRNGRKAVGRRLSAELSMFRDHCKVNIARDFGAGNRRDVTQCGVFSRRQTAPFM